MKFCEACNRALKKETITGSVIMRCNCGMTYTGDPSDSLIYSSFRGTDSNIGLLLHLAPYDRVNQLINQSCPNCPLKYMTLVSTNDDSWLVCKCGTILSGTDIDIGSSI